MDYPTLDEAFRLLKEYKTPENVIDHSNQVAKVALFVARKLNEKNPGSADMDLLHRAAILHDIVRYIDFKDFDNLLAGVERPKNEVIDFWKQTKEKLGKKHTEAGYEIFKDDYPKLAKIIRKHAYKAVVSEDPEFKPITMEEKILAYADKRVAHDKIVTLKERFEEGHKRWQASHQELSDLEKEEIKMIDGAYFELEKELFEGLNVDPDKIGEMIDN